METSVKNTLKYYCELQIVEFNSSSIFSILSELVESQESKLKIDFGKAKDDKDENLYLSLSIHDKNDELIEIFDEGYLTTSTMLKNPTKIVSQALKTKFKYVGKNAVVILNKTGKVITTWAKHKVGRRIGGILLWLGLNSLYEN